MHHNFNPFPILKTQRLVLRQIEDKDVDIAHNYFSDKANFPHVNMKAHTNLEQTIKYLDFLEDGVKENRWIVWAIALKSTDEIIGTVSLWNLNIDKNKGELGYGLFPGNQSKGYMTESLIRVCDYGYKTMGLSSIEAYTNESNKKSIKLLLKSGFSYVKTLIEDGQNMSVYEKYSDIKK